MLFTSIDHRIARDREDSDVSYFAALCLKLEMLTKVVTSATVACIDDDVDRHRYKLEHSLVRADSLGSWVAALNDALTGAPAQFFIADARPLVNDLNRRVGAKEWQYGALEEISSAAHAVDAPAELGQRGALRQFFEIGTNLRNRGRAHGATTAGQCSSACPFLQRAIDTVVSNLSVFQLSWVHLHRNLSGKYRVTPLLGDQRPFEYLKRSSSTRRHNGIHFAIDDRHTFVPLISSDSNAANLFLPNGNYKRRQFEVLSYASNEMRRQDGSEWDADPDRPPPSETEGRHELDVVGETFTNIPPSIVGYITRKKLESDVVAELTRTDHHPIVTLTGPGGIGKTTLAIASLHEVVKEVPGAYEHVLWISARDVDLLESGPHPVSPRVNTRKDIADAAASLLQPVDPGKVRRSTEEFLKGHLNGPHGGNTLLVIDNFETVKDPTDVFRWLDTFVRPPNKVLITTRLRDFVGDFHIEITGMSDDEAQSLIEAHSRRLRIETLIDRRYVEQLIRESDGHPYVIKILLGSVAEERRAVSPERIVANSEMILRALFERTYSALSPSAQRIFLLLSSWRVRIPEIAVEAVSLRPGNERFAVREALKELRRFSLTDQVRVDDGTDVYFVGVPLAAAMYGRRKLEVSQFRANVEEDRKLLMQFGAGSDEMVRRGVLHRIEKFVEHVAGEAASDLQVLEERRPILDYLALSVPSAYKLLAELVLEVGGDTALDQAKEYMRQFLENCDGSARKEGWRRLGELCSTGGDWIGSIHASVQLALEASATVEEMGEAANQINFVISEMKAKWQWKDRAAEVAAMVREVVAAMEKERSKLSATDCSRLGWLLVNIGKIERAKEIARFGTTVDPANAYCWNLLEKLDARG